MSNNHNGHGHGHGHGAGNGGAADFASIGTTFNDATNLLVGGITAQNHDRIVSDLQSVQTKLQALIEQNPQQFSGVAGIHAQNVVDQINLEMQAINTLGSDPTAPKYINDVQRDLIDIVQGDDVLRGLAQAHHANGFAAVPDLLAPPKQFQGSQEQTDFMTRFAADAVDLGNKAVALADGNDTAAKAALVQEIQSFDSNANTFTVAQGGLYSARFNNEFADNGVNGTASRVLIHGLQTNNADEVKAAAEVLSANAQDVAGNMLGIGQPVPVTGPRVPDHVDNLAQAGAVFNDATTQLVGGVWSGNKTAVLEDLQATQNFLKALVAADPATYSGKAGTDAASIIDKLGQEITAVNTADTDPNAAQAIRAIHTQIIATVQHDAVLKAAATDGDVTGFSQLPAGAKGAPDQVAHGGPAGGAAGDHGGAQHDPHTDHHDALAHAFAHGGHMWG